MPSSSAATPEQDRGHENVDDLVSELTLLDDGVFAQLKKAGEDHSANILEVTERHSQNQLTQHERRGRARSSCQFVTFMTQSQILRCTTLSHWMIFNNKPWLV